MKFNQPNYTAPQKKEETSRTLLLTLEKFFEAWGRHDENNNQISNARNLTIQNSEFAVSYSKKSFLPKLNCTNLVIHNCGSVNVGNLQFILRACDLTKLKQLTISFDGSYAGYTIHPKEIENISQVIEEKYRDLSHVNQIAFKREFTFSCETNEVIDANRQNLISHHAKSVNIVVNGEKLTPVMAVA